MSAYIHPSTPSHQQALDAIAGDGRVTVGWRDSSGDGRGLQSLATMDHADQLDSVITFARRLPGGTDQLAWLRRGYGPRHLRRAAHKATHRTRHAAAWLARHAPSMADLCGLPAGIGSYTLSAT